MCGSDLGTIHIVVDDRERAAGLVDRLHALENVVVEQRRLPLGDYRVDGCLLFERKTLPDFARSVIDGRFFLQVTRLATARLTGILILEGSSRDLEGMGIRREALQGALVTASLILGVPVLRSLSQEETAGLLTCCARQVRQRVAGAIVRGGCRPRGRRKRQLYILQGLPSVGPKRAGNLLNHFGSVKKVFGATAAEIAAVEGVGDTTARNITAAVNEGLAPYGETVPLYPP